MSRAPAEGGWSLVTERLVIRPFATTDVDAFHAYRSDPQVARWQGWSLPYTREDAETFVAEVVGDPLFRRGKWTQLAVALRSAPDALLGDFGVRLEVEEPTAEIGVTFARASQGHGYATEGLRALVAHLISERGFERVVAITLVVNEPTQRLLGRAGFEAVAQDGDELIFSCRG